MVEVVQVRDGLDSDVGWILDLGAALFQDLGDYREILGHWLELPRTRILVAELEGESVGFALISPGRSIGFLWRGTCLGEHDLCPERTRFVVQSPLALRA